jgi:hypothetical protein
MAIAFGVMDLALYKFEAKRMFEKWSAVILGTC